MALGLLSVALAGTSWAVIWYFVSAFVQWIYWPNNVGAYLLPALVIPWLYFPFLGRAVAIRLGRDLALARLTFLAGGAGAVVAGYLYLVMGVLQLTTAASR